MRNAESVVPHLRARSRKLRETHYPLLAEISEEIPNALARLAFSLSMHAYAYTKRPIHRQQSLIFKGFGYQ